MMALRLLTSHQSGGDFGCLHKGLLQVNIVPKIS